MIHAFYAPTPPLDRFVEYLWTCDTYVAPTARERVLPTGAQTIVIHLRDAPMYVYPDAATGDAQRMASAVLCGARSAPLVIDTALGPTVGVHFKAGGARAFFDVSADALTDDAVSLEALWGPSASALHARLLETPSPHAQARVVEQYLLRRLGRARELSSTLRTSLHAFDDPRLASVAEVNRRTGCSPKRLIALYRDEIGLSPKAFWRVRRFRSALRDLDGGALRGAALAAEHGYCDQAHFLREFRALAGSTPTEYLAARIVGSDHVSVGARVAALAG